jgi:hypothetical protein
LIGQIDNGDEDESEVEDEDDDERDFIDERETY